MIVHGVYLRRVYRQRARQRAQRLNGSLKHLADTWVQVETTRFVLNGLIFLAGAGVLMGFRQSAYLLAVLPLVSILSSTLALRFFD